jgi:DNA/RNA-binding domain of Phe-tRNA-synthetase-like protein
MAFPVTHSLAGWTLVWAELALAPDATSAAAAGLASYSEAARSTGLQPDEPVVAAVRRLFRAAGTDPTRYRPSSEALIRRLVRGDALPSIHPLVDLNNCLSIALRVPSCVMGAGSIRPPVELRAGTAGELMDSLRGPFDLAGKPVLADLKGPFGTPITDSERVAVREQCSRGWLVAYLPSGLVSATEVERHLRGPLGAIATVVEMFSTGD